MSKIMRYKNLKMKLSAYTNIPSEAAGPYTMGASSTWYSAFVPCMGARQVVFHAREASGAGNWTVQSAIAGNDPLGGDALAAAGADVVVRGDASVVALAGDGIRFAVVPSAGLHHHGYIACYLTTDATAKVGVYINAEVVYEGDASDDMVGFGQGGLTAATY